MISMRQRQLWMGNIQPFMTENFILMAFRKMGENPLDVKIMCNKVSRKQTGYCFVHFATSEEVAGAMHKLNGKAIPGTTPVVRFRLKKAICTSDQNPTDREFTVWVEDLSPDVDEYNLYCLFASKYESIKTVKVLLDNNGFSKGYGFVKFSSEDEMKHALCNMNGYVGLGTKALRVCNAVSKGAITTTTESSTSIAITSATDYNQYYRPITYWQNYQNWQSGYYVQGNSTTATESNTSIVTTSATDYNQDYKPTTYWQNYQNWQSGYYVQGNSLQPSHDMSPSSSSEMVPSMTETQEEDDLELVEHSVPLDVDELNRQVMEQDALLWDALESSKWSFSDTFDNN